MQKILMPSRIIKSHNVLKEENILIEKPLQPPLIFSGDIVDGCILIKKDGYILLDFGKELNGGIKLTVQRVSDTSAQLKIVFGESVMEALSELGEKNSANDHSIREYIIPAIGLTSQRIGETGFRFVRIEAKNTDVMIRSVKAVLEITDAVEIGSFECNDERINKIWQTAVYTVKLNMQEMLLEGVKRDRLVWIGDMHPEVSTIKAVFGKDECVEKSLDFVRDTTPKGEWMNNTGTYSMWWIINHYDWYMHWGDFDYLKKQIPCMKSTCDHAFPWIEDDLKDVENKMVNFVDWSSKNTDSEYEGRKSIFCMGMDCASKLFNIVGESDYSEKCKKHRDMLLCEKIEKENNKRMSALTVLSGRDSEIAQKVLSGNSPKEMSTFMGYYVLKAKALLGDHSDAVDIISGYWGAMLDKGATTFWEDFDIDWTEGSGRIDEITPTGLKDIHGDFGKHCYEGFRHSLCHGWASGPAPFLMEEIGGIEILEPGCKKVKISPNLGGLKWVKISYPTPYGNIDVLCNMIDGKEQIDIKAPKEIEVIQ